MSLSTNPSTSLPTLTEYPASWRGSSLLSVTQITPEGLLMLFSKSQAMRKRVRVPAPPAITTLTLVPPKTASTAQCAEETPSDDNDKNNNDDDGDNHKLPGKGKILATIFFEASTRTSCSFQAAMCRLGGTYLHVDGKGNTSAGQKGESLADTVACLQSYTDVTVLRHPVTGSVAQVVETVHKPVINAGDGVGEHPTQALLDVFTIYDELGLLSNSNKKQKLNETSFDAASSSSKKSLTVVLLGDLKHGRTVHSLAKLLSRSAEILLQSSGGRTALKLRYCAPPLLEMPESVQSYCAEYSSVVQQESISMGGANSPTLVDVCSDADVLYVTRIQQERFETPEAYEQVKGSYVVSPTLMEAVPKHMIVMHPLPRVDEIETTVDTDPRAAYFRQMENGMYVRMAILSLILG